MTFARQIATAQRLIKKNGAAVTWRKFVQPVDDNPANPGVPTNDDHPVTVAFFPNDKLSLLTTLSMIAGTEVPSGRVYGLMGAVNFEPGMDDLIVGTPYGDLRLIDKYGIERLAPNGETILYTLRFTL